MWRVHRLDQINALKPANPLDFRSLTLRAAGKQIGRFKIVIRPRGCALLHKGSFAQQKRTPDWNHGGGISQHRANIACVGVFALRSRSPLLGMTNNLAQRAHRCSDFRAMVNSIEKTAEFLRARFAGEVVLTAGGTLPLLSSNTLNEKFFEYLRRTDVAQGVGGWAQTH
jgi:hypothetical protein